MSDLPTGVVFDPNKYLEKEKARQKLTRAIERGHLVRPEHCSKCRRKSRVQGHHTDYSKPLEIVWLCRSCHRAEHAEGR
jgi:Bacillus phage endonuclease